jgi:hypothetical protein
MAVTREQVLAAYAANPFAEARPSEEAIQFWQNTGLGSFDQTVAAVRAENPALAAQIDTQRGNVSPAPAPAAAPTLFSAPTPTPAPTPATTAPLPANFNSSGTYLAFVDNLKNKDVDPLAAINSLNVGPEFKQAITTIYNEMVQQQKAGTAEYWGTGTLATKEGAAAEMALRLAEGGATSLSDITSQPVTRTEVDGEGGERTFTETQLVSKATGKPINYNTNSGGLKLNYDIQTLPDGTVVPVATKRESDWMKFREGVLKPGVAIALSTLGAPIIGAAVAPGAGLAMQGALGGAIAGGGSAALTGGNILQGALLGGAGGYFQGANAGANNIGTSIETDASFLANDAARLATQGLSESQITDILGASGYASGPAASLAASMAVNGLDVGMMTQQLNALSTNTGLMSQTGSSADFAATDALRLRDQVGNNFPAIEQNLIASGVDPLIAADISQQLAFNPGLTQTQLAGNLSTSFGNNIYDVNMAQTYPTSVLPGAGGLLSNVPPASSVSTTTGANVTTGGATSGLTPSQIANLVKAGVSLAGVTGAVSAVSGGGSNTPLQAPTQGVPTNDPNYYNQLQQYYNAYLPQTPRDVVTPLQQWYNSSYGA